MRCPACREHITPLMEWVQQFVDAADPCPHCGARLLPTYRPLWWGTLALPFSLCGTLWAIAAPNVAVAILLVLVVAPLVATAVYWVGWATGTYSRDESVPGAEGDAAGAELDPYDLRNLLRAATQAEKAGDIPRAIAKYEAISEYAGGSHPNAELARERVRALRAKLGEPDAGK